ncbi:MAG: ATP-dependent DNA helicase RecG [Phycisphaerae bacterium]|nr:ATP-dependent DNA helicase RecG [Phycisphaerae bacterium]
MGDLELDTPIQYVKGVGPRRAEQLETLGVKTLEDLMMYFPRRFDLRREVQPICTLNDGDDNATIAGEIIDARQRHARRPIFEIQLRDESASITAKWFHGGYLAQSLRPGLVVALNGKISSYNNVLQMVNPKHQIIYDPSGAKLDQDELLPVYPAGGKLTSNIIASVIQKALPQATQLLSEWFDKAYLAKRGLMTRDKAIFAMHRPEDREQWAHARRRLAYEECLLMQLGIAITRQKEISRPAHSLLSNATVDQRIRARFPFTLTDAQDRTVAEITADLARNRPMNRLLQGDVGSGKTVVALYAALLTVANKKQVAIMAPTGILATQHYRKILAYLENSNVKTELLTGGMPVKKRNRVLAELENGDIHIIVGTHALLSKTVKFKDLALVVVDEQHKFGVEQRTGIRGKGFAPHYLVMTATPIPRTLALTVFGDLDVSTIDASPPGRGKTTTKCVSAKDIPATIKFVEKKLATGQQAYFIYPLVTPSPQLELTAAQEAYHELKDGPLGKYGVGLVHGQMPSDAKNSAMRDFSDGKTKILVASVVVEVGVDVPAANVMVITHAERFGLAQLHQLRGRVGRSTENANCILIASPGNPLALKRMEILTKTCDGFKIAEEDLRIRGPGEFFGTKQHGLPELKVADLIEDFELLRLARRDAFDIIDEDPDLAMPHNQQLRRAMLKLYADRLGLIAGA